MIKQRKIHVLYFEHSSTLGGAERYLEILMNGLPPVKFEIVCMCTSKRVGDFLKNRLRNRSVSILYYKMHNPSITKSVIPLTRVIKKIDPDIIHCNGIDGYGLSSYFLLAGRISRIKVLIGTFHTPMMIYPEYSLSERIFGYLIDKSLTASIVVSKTSKEQALNKHRIPSNKIRVIYNGVSLPKTLTFKEYSIEKNIIKIGTLARLIPGKGISVLLKAVEILIQKYRDFSLNIIGDGPEKDELQVLANQLGISQWVNFAGWIDDISQALACLDIFIFPSFAEGLPISILEAMAHGVPVIASSVGGIPEIIEDAHTGYLVPPGNPQALADALFKLIKDPDKRRAMAYQSRSRVENHFSEELMVQNTIQLYNELLHAKGYLD